MATRTYECPYSADRLRDLYYRELYSISEIALLAWDICKWNLIPTRGVVERWFREASISIRNSAEAARIRTRTRGTDVLQRKRRARLIEGSIYLGDASQMHTPEARRAKLRSHARKRKTLLTDVRCPIDGTQFQTYLSRPRIYCCRACANTANKSRDVVIRRCPVCNEIVKIKPSRAQNSDHTYCSRRCSNMGRNVQS